MTSDPVPSSSPALSRLLEQAAEEGRTPDAWLRLAAVCRAQRDPAAALAATDQRGVDVILDMVGGEYTSRNVLAAAPDGRIALIATQGGSQATIDLRVVMVRRLEIAGSTLRPQAVERKGRIAAALRERVWPLFATNRLLPPIHARFALADAAKAHALMESGQHVGKIVLQVRLR